MCAYMWSSPRCTYRVKVLDFSETEDGADAKWLEEGVVIAECQSEGGEKIPGTHQLSES